MKKILLTIKIAFLFCFLFGNIVKAQTANVYEYYNATYQKHFYTTDYNEIGTGKYGFVLTDTKLGSLYTTKITTFQSPVYRYLQPSTGAHYYTTNSNQVPSGFNFEKIIGYTPPSIVQSYNVYEYYNASTFDYFYTTQQLVGASYTRIAFTVAAYH